ncbi:thiamine pyrophosphate-requiring protein [Haloplanus pelagicus]|jgi:acetolactate synthase-1/2/3 large subunit|uniref:thiamine pyrophosphate-requiring protein n=1 Tax=Haloplanus pelagicus TaxID=2949995 RepID=UPI00203F7D7A|nr:thiamine pyrophosphate-requiring protein [Haloplanus sp. HW8-1]
MIVTDAVAGILAEEGVEHLVGFPSNPLFDDDAAEDAGIRSIVVRQERTGAHILDGIARITSGDQVEAFACQHGPGTENSVGGIAQAYAESAPIVALPAGYSRAKTNTDPKFSSLINYQAVTKTTEQLTDPAATEETIRRAFQAARNGRQRPGLVEIPKDVFSEAVGEIDYEPTSSTRTAPDPRAVEAAVDALLDAELPVINAGQGVHYAKAWEPLLELADLLEAPVATTLNGKSAFPEDHPLALGAGSKSEPRQLNHFVNEADVLFGIGCSFTETAYGITPPTEDNTLIHSTNDPGDVDKDYKSDLAVIGDAKLVLEAIVDGIEDRVADTGFGRYDDVTAEISEVEAAWRDDWADVLTSDETPINPYRVVHELDRTLDKEEVVATADAGNTRDFMAPFFEVTEPLSYLGWGKTTQLGYGLGLMMGAKLIHPEKTCVHVMGDGAIGMVGMDFETAVREDIPIIAVVLNNFEMASYDTPFSGHYADFAESMGGYGERIEDPENVSDAIERAVQKTEAGTPVLLEFLTATYTELSRPDLE